MSSIFIESLFSDELSGATVPSNACVPTKGKGKQYCDGVTSVYYNGCCRRRNSTCNGGAGYIGQKAGWDKRTGYCINFPPGKERGKANTAPKDPGFNPESKCQNCKECQKGVFDPLCGFGHWYCMNIGKPGCEAGAKGQDVFVDPMERYMPMFMLMGVGVIGVILITKFT